MARAHLRTAGLTLAGLSLLVAACRPAPEKPAEPAPPPAAATPTIPTATPPLGRAELLDGVAAAASAYAAGAPEPDAAKALAGRTFSLRLPFGCGPTAAETSIGYVYDARRGALRLSARPEVWTDARWAQALIGSPDTEAIEGFWIRRPWIRGEGCPAQIVPLASAAPAAKAAGGAAAVPTAPRPAPPSPETVGLAQSFEKGGSRLLRRGTRGYEATLKAGPDEAPGLRGFRLVLEGRVVSADGRGPVRCRSDSPERRPVCLVQVEFDRVAFEEASGAVLSEWRS